MQQRKFSKRLIMFLAIVLFSTMVINVAWVDAFAEDTEIPYLEETVVSNGLRTKMTVLGIAESADESFYTINVEFENKTSKAVNYWASDLVVNSIYFDAFATGDVEPKSHVTFRLFVKKEELKSYNITEFQNIKFSVKLKNSGSEKITQQKNIVIDNSDSLVSFAKIKTALLNPNYYGILVAAICAIIIAILIPIAIKDTRKKRRAFVVETSEKLRKIRALNARYNFYPLKPTYFVSKYCNYKKTFDNLYLNDFLIGEIIDCRLYYKELLQQVRYNKEQYAKYENEYVAITGNRSEKESILYETHRYYAKMEVEECSAIKLHPVTNFVTRVSKYYSSEKGRSKYADSLDYSIQRLEDCIKQADEITKKRKTVNYERSKMSDSLRYDVMKRDMFQCVLCGAQKSDGVKLEVDHIIPVSKGGKTEMDNLRTLCERYNRGKRDKYDPDGPN